MLLIATFFLIFSVASHSPECSTFKHSYIRAAVALATAFQSPKELYTNNLLHFAVATCSIYLGLQYHWHFSSLRTFTDSPQVGYRNKNVENYFFLFKETKQAEMSSNRREELNNNIHGLLLLWRRRLHYARFSFCISTIHTKIFGRSALHRARVVPDLLCPLSSPRGSTAPSEPKTDDRDTQTVVEPSRAGVYSFAALSFCSALLCFSGQQQQQFDDSPNGGALGSTCQSRDGGGGSQFLGYDAINILSASMGPKILRNVSEIVGNPFCGEDQKNLRVSLKSAQFHTLSIKEQDGAVAFP